MESLVHQVHQVPREFAAPKVNSGWRGREEKKVNKVRISIADLNLTREHSSRMRTTRLATVRAPATRYQYWWGMGPQVNKFVQVSTDGHQMSLAGDEARAGGVLCLMSGEGGTGSCTMRSNASRVMVTWGPPSPSHPYDQTDTSENITFPQLRWRAVIKPCY